MNKRKKKIITEPFDRYKNPPKQNLFIMPFLWIWCYIATRSGHLRIHKINTTGLKPPYIVFGSHHSFMDFYVTPLALFPHRANYVSELEGFEAYGEWKYRQIGCLGTRKFVNDMALVKNIKRVMERKGILVLYPEARYANVGTNSKLPPSIGKLCKILDVPIVTINMKGHYLQSPIWNLRKRKGVKLDATLTQLYTKEEVKKASADEIQSKIQSALTYNDYNWQRKAGIKIKESWRAEGLHKPLYQCPVCNEQFRMGSRGKELFCKSCEALWTLDEDGYLVSKEGEKKKIEDWYEWQRDQVKEEILNGVYGLDAEVQIYSLPNAVNFIDLGTGYLHHDKEGFILKFREYGEQTIKSHVFTSISCFSVHTEYDYRGKGQCITLSTQDNSYFIFPKQEGFSSTKIQFATEYFWELAQHLNKKTRK